MGLFRSGILTLCGVKVYHITGLAPTRSPTATPTLSPTAAPMTVAPTSSPTANPTPTPTSTPTSIPTAAPTRSPVVALDLSSATATQSSTGYGGIASRAVTSPTPSSTWGHGTCTATNHQSTPWWKVDLGATYNVAEVEVLNRGDCCWDRLNGFDVSVGSTTCASNVQIGQGASVTVACVGTGSSVTISLSRSGVLTLCGVKVYQTLPPGS